MRSQSLPNCRRHWADPWGVKSHGPLWLPQLTVPSRTVARARPATTSSLPATGLRAGERRDGIRKAFEVLKIALPLAALATLAIFGATVLKNVGHRTRRSRIFRCRKSSRKISRCKNPHYEGFNADGGHYWVKAETAQQDLKSLTVVRLNGITGELTDAKKQKTNLVATRGLFDNKANVLELYDLITVSSDGGLNANLTRATVKTKEGIVTSDQPSTIIMAAGQITSKQLTIRQKTKEYTFLENVRAHMKPKDRPAATTADAAQATSLRQAGRARRHRLEPSRHRRRKENRIFSGGVVATQAGATMKSPELTVTYEGAVAPQGTAPRRTD